MTELTDLGADPEDPARAKLAPHNVRINYTNYKGVRRDRTIEPPLEIWYGTTPYHKDPQWLLDAVCAEKGRRTFAMKDIHSWEPEKTSNGEKSA